jgi:ElaB/YqjD/DUF883 family membrane-anchored ribosome-binding protein
MSESSVTKDIEALQADFSRLRGDLAALTKTIGEQSKRRAANGAENLKEMGNRAAGQVRAMAAEANALKDAGLEATARQVSEHPVSSLLIAFAAGVLLGKLVDRR